MTKSLMKQVLRFYRTSRDFNGLNIAGASSNILSEAERLTKEKLIQVVTEEDYPNPHIRPWPSKRTIDQQIESISNEDDNAICLYPTAKALKQYKVKDAYSDRPFTYDMSQGRGTLELAYFQFDVLEPYRNDPRFIFNYNDFGVEISISTASYLDKMESEEDKIIIKHLGYSYDLSHYNINDASTPIIRRICAFYGDLTKLSSNHQQRWKTYQILSNLSLKAHPVWWQQQMGHFADGIGPFSRLFYEIKALNELCTLMCGVNLFKKSDRPSEFGWIVRPSLHEWDSFISQLDKIISENINAKALNILKVPKKNDDDQPIGSLKRLAMLLQKKGIPKEVVSDILMPLFKVREARQRPAHKLQANKIDHSLIHKQVVLMDEVNICLMGLRRFWMNNSLCNSWEEPSYLSENSKYYRM